MSTALTARKPSLHVALVITHIDVSTVFSGRGMTFRTEPNELPKLMDLR